MSTLLCHHESLSQLQRRSIYGTMSWRIWSLIRRMQPPNRIADFFNKNESIRINQSTPFPSILPPSSSLSPSFSPNRASGLREFGAFKWKIWRLVRVVLVTFTKNYVYTYWFPLSMGKHSNPPSPQNISGASAPKFIQCRRRCLSVFSDVTKPWSQPPNPTVYMNLMCPRVIGQTFNSHTAYCLPSSTHYKMLVEKLKMFNWRRQTYMDKWTGIWKCASDSLTIWRSR